MHTLTNQDLWPTVYPEFMQKELLQAAVPPSVQYTVILTSPKQMHCPSLWWPPSCQQMLHLHTNIPSMLLNKPYLAAVHMVA